MDCQKSFDASDEDLDETNSCSPLTVCLEIKTKQTDVLSCTTTLRGGKTSKRHLKYSTRKICYLFHFWSPYD